MIRDRVQIAFECKNTDDDARTFEGYGSVFGTIDSYDDIVAKGAFKRSLKEWRSKGRMPAMLWQHDTMEPVGVWTDIREDDTGLYVKGELLTTGRGPMAYEALKKGALSGLSIGFQTRKSKMDDETGIRTLTDVDLWEISLVTFPANDPARVAVVKSSDLPDAVEFERWLRRDAELTRAEAKRVVATCYKRLLRHAAGMESPEDTAPCRVEGQRDEELIAALRSVVAGEPRHGSGSQGADRSDRA